MTEKQILPSEVTCVIKGSQGVRSQIGEPQEAKESSQENSSENFWRLKTITGHRNLFQHVKVNDIMRDQGQWPVDSNRFEKQFQSWVIQKVMRKVI